MHKIISPFIKEFEERWNYVLDPLSLGLSAATLATLSTTGTIIGGATSAAGALVGGISGYNSYSYKAAVAQQNAQIAKNNAAYSLWEGGQNAQRQGLADQFALGKIVSGQAASGVDVSSGSAAQIQQSQAGAAQQNQMMIRSNASRKAYGYDVEATNMLNEAKMDKAAGSMSLVSGGLNATSSLIGGATSVSDKWIKFGRQGAGTENLSLGDGSSPLY